MGTEATIISEEEEAKEAEERTEIAGLFPRLLAALIDYLIVATATLLFGKVTAYSDYTFLVTFVIGALYFGTGASHTLQGQTLGKRLFGIRVVTRDINNRFLSFRAGLFRYFCSYGVIILGAEVPTVLYRMIVLSTNPTMLEFHMLLVLMYFISNAALVGFSNGHQGIHDAATASLVIRGPEDAPLDSFVSTPGFNRRILLGISAFLALLLWLPSITHGPAVTVVQKNRYVLESQTGFRLVGAAETAKELSIHLIFTKQIAEIVGEKPELPTELVVPSEEVFQLLAQRGLSAVSSLQAVSFEIDAIDENFELHRFTTTKMLGRNSPSSENTM